MPSLLEMVSDEKVKAVVFSTPAYNTDYGELQLPTSTSHQDLPSVEAAGESVQTLTNTVTTRDSTSFLIQLGTYKFDFAFLSTSALASFSRARSLVERILCKDKAKNQPSEDEGKLIVKDSRSGKSYNVPIRKGSVDAMQFRQMITTSKFSALLGRPLQGSLKVLDVGYQNTACAESNITYV
jgi:hypothetical protein